VLCKEHTQAKDVYAVNLNTCKEIRHQTADCFERSRDALFELVDALCSEPQARSLPELSLSPSFRRKWSSVYEALEDGRVNERKWGEIWTQALLREHRGPVWVSVDSTSIPRPEAETSPDRGMIYLPNLPHTKKPVSVGWQFSTVMLLPDSASSWGAILSQRRISSTQTAVGVAIEQLEKLVATLPVGTRVLADRWYATGPFVRAGQRLHLEALVRLKRNRKLYRQAPPRVPRQRGAPRKDGDLFQGSQPQTWGEPAADWHGADHRGKPIQVQAWQHLHFRQARDVELTVYRVVRQGATGTRRDPRESWFLWMGAELLPLEEVVSCYQRRFSHEHTYRFLKQDLRLYEGACAHRTAVRALECGGSNGHEPIGAGPLLWESELSSVGKAPSSRHAAASASRHARAFVAVWNTSACAQSAWKIAGLAQGEASNPACAF
jgi:hypothetical protein